MEKNKEDNQGVKVASILQGIKGGACEADKDNSANWKNPFEAENASIGYAVFF